MCVIIFNHLSRIGQELLAAMLSFIYDYYTRMYIGHHCIHTRVPTAIYKTQYENPACESKGKKGQKSNGESGRGYENADCRRSFPEFCTNSQIKRKKVRLHLSHRLLVFYSSGMKSEGGSFPFPTLIRASVRFRSNDT